MTSDEFSVCMAVSRWTLPLFRQVPNGGQVDFVIHLGLERCTGGRERIFFIRLRT